MELSDKKPAMDSLQPHGDSYTHNKAELGGNKSIMCSVLFLDIVAYSRKSVAQQMELKNCLNNSLAEAISLVPTDDRIILDTVDGAAISFLGDVEDALRVALILRENLQHEGAKLETPLLVRIGINLGPVRLIRGTNGQPNIVGDGINVARRVMEFSEAGQILISRSYGDAISSLSPEYAGMLHHHGKFTDKNVREHEVYEVRHYEETIQPESDADVEENARMDPEAGRNLNIFEKIPLVLEKAASQPRILLGGILVGILLLVVARMIKVEPQAAITAQSKEMAQVQQVIASAGSGMTSMPMAGQTAQEKPGPAMNVPEPQEQSIQKQVSKEKSLELPTAKSAATVEAAKMATLSVAVTPWGEVYLDGRIRGISPPLNELKIKPGSHRIEIRNKTFKKYSQDFQVKAGEKIEIKYKYTDPLK